MPPAVFVYLVHHGEAVGPEVDPLRPLSAQGLAAVERLAALAAARGAKPAVVWHSGKLRARQTAQQYWRACNALAGLSATRDLQPDDPPAFIRDRLRAEPRDLMLVGHFPHLPALRALLTGASGAQATFPPHGIVALRSLDAGESWEEVWRIEC
ncbi:MAG: phosphohistidine phosphatase SixA [Acidobacteria bacterium]|nr:phosphohistidine phosphatase SixA [Acidobacteriota bacterium]